VVVVRILATILLVAFVVAAVRTDPWYLTAVVAGLVYFAWRRPS